jgi:hypothetical protein
MEPKSKVPFTTSLPVSVLETLDRVAYEENRRKNDIIAETVLLWNAKHLRSVLAAVTKSPITPPVIAYKTG